MDSPRTLRKSSRSVAIVVAKLSISASVLQPTKATEMLRACSSDELSLNKNPAAISSLTYNRVVRVLEKTGIDR